MAEVDDRQDIARVLAGDAEAFAGIVERWRRPLLGLAWRFCRDRDRAEDMAQEALVRAFKQLRLYRGDAPFGAWLLTLAANCYRSRLRRNPPPTIALEDAPPPAVEADDICAMERAQAVRDAVTVLPPRYRDVVALFYFHEMDIAEAARSLGLPEGTVKARLHRAKDLLRRKLARVAPTLAAAKEA